MVEGLNMTQEEKQLLFIDLCMRLPYHPNIKVYNDGWDGMQIGEIDTNLWTHHIDAFWCSRIEITPYLRPLSSMTEEERMFVNKTLFSESDNFMIDDVGEIFTESQPYETIYTLSLKIQSEYFNWLNSHFFDFRGLIELGLALEAPKDMYE